MKKNIAVFGDISMNGIDGSSIWLQSICNIFPKDKYNIHLILRDKISTTVILDGLQNVNIISPFNHPILEKAGSDPCTPYELYLILKELNSSVHLDHIILRAPRYVLFLAEKAKTNQSYRVIASKIDMYLAKIDIEYSYERRIISESQDVIGRLIVQTEESRSLCELFYPKLRNRVIVLNPMTPDVDISFVPKAKVGDFMQNITIVYSGKLDKTYCVEEFADLSVGNPSYKTIFIGDKANSNKEDKTFPQRILKKLESYHSSGSLLWIKKLERSESIVEIGKATFIMAIRDPLYDSSIEISTKLLEAMSVGCLPILRRNVGNEALLGRNYPYYCDSVQDIGSLEFDLNIYFQWMEIVQDTAREFSFSNTYRNMLSPYYESDRPLSAKVPLKILIASHDNKFLIEIIEYIKSIKNVEVKFDTWTATNKHDLTHSKNMLEWADIVLCEWAVGPAVFYSQNKKENQKLLIRLHRFEITTNLPQQINIDAVDSIIVVSPYLKKHCIANYSWPEDKITVLPQYANIKNFNRSKVKAYDYQFNLGILGVVPRLKRLDRAIDLLEELRKKDERYVLHIKSKMPWDIPFVWNKIEEQDYYLSLFKRIEKNPLLKNGIIFHKYGDDVADWFRKIGWILSTSDIEGCHTAVAEAMSTGTKPVLFDWPGVEGVYKGFPIFTEPKSAADYICNNYGLTLDVNLEEYAIDNFDISHTINFYVNFVFSDHERLKEV